MQNIAALCFVMPSTKTLVVAIIALWQFAAATEAAEAIPDLHGWWAYTSDTPWQRPHHLADQRAYSLSELGELENQAWQRGFGYEALQLAEVNGEFRTSLIVAPHNGRVPYLPEYAVTQPHTAGVATGARGPEAYATDMRCLGPAAQLPILAPSPEDSLAERSIHIVQTENYLAIHQNAGNALRIIKLQGAQLPYPNNQWLGDSLAAFDGDSLVINTFGLREEQSNNRLQSSGQMQIYERLTLLGPDRLLYTYTVFDPGVLALPFTVEMPLERLPSAARLPQVACHENNQTLPAALLSRRLREAMN